MFTLCLSHDVDRPYKTFQSIYYALESIKNHDLKNFYYHLSSITGNPYWCFEKVISIEKSYGVKSTFFFLNEGLKFNPFKPKEWKLSLGRYSFNDENIINVIKWIDKEGWEIGLHGSYYSYCNIDLLKKEKAELEQIIGHSVNGIRQHYLNLDENTWQIQSGAEFQYDSTYSLKNDVGFKEGNYYPFHPIPNINFTVIPLTIMDSNLMSKKDPKQEYRKILEEAEIHNAIVVLNWHQRTFNEKEFPGYASMYEEIIDFALKEGAKIGPICEILKDYDK